LLKDFHDKKTSLKDVPDVGAAIAAPHLLIAPVEQVEAGKHFLQLDS
jgi:hypothetical protein